MSQDVFLRLAVHNVDIVIRQIDWLYPVAGGINHPRDISAIHVERDQLRHQAYSYRVVMQFFRETSPRPGTPSRWPPSPVSSYN